MNIIPASYQIMQRPQSDGALKFLERIGRVCYKSENLITDTSAKDFVAMLANKGHLAMLEHYRFILNVGAYRLAKIKEIDPELLRYVKMTSVKDRCLISGSARAFIDLYLRSGSVHVGGIFDFLCDRFPALFDHVRSAYPYPQGIYLVEDPTTLTVEERLAHETLTVLFTVDRGVTHEFVRHRPTSFAQESTRYCNYGKDKFGSNVTFIDIRNGITIENKIPEDHVELVAKKIEEGLAHAEKVYLELLEMGATPQIARSVLPNATKSDIVLTDTLDQWLNVKFPLRTASTAHPQMREVMCQLHLEAQSLPEYKDIFGGSK
jgi:thymidylate synthase (FAD)